MKKKKSKAPPAKVDITIDLMKILQRWARAREEAGTIVGRTIPIEEVVKTSVIQ